MVYFYFLIYIFFSQFPSLVNIGSSYIGLHLVFLPLIYLYIPKVKLIINFVLPIIFLSWLIGFLKYFQLNILEIILRLVGLSTIISSLILPIILYKKSKDIYFFKNKYIRPIIYLSIPNLVFCLLELVYRISKNGNLYTFLAFLKNSIFVPNRGSQVIGSISGLFPEHGLFAPFLLFILGISFWLINHSRINSFFLLSVSWIFVSIFHSSGLFIASIGLSVLIFFSLFLISVISKLKISKKSFRIFILIASTLIFAITVARYSHPFLYDRFSDIFNNFDINIIATMDKSLGYKLLPYFALFQTTFLELLIGSGAGYFSQLIISKVNILPSFLLSNSYFVQNLSVGRFALNSTIVCSILEYGIIIWIALILILRNYIKLFNPISLFIYFSNILRYKLNLNELISFIFFMACFLSLLGPVPLSYPFPVLSLSLMLILLDNKKSSLTN